MEILNTKVLKILDIYFMKKIFSNDINDIKYLFNQNEDVCEDNKNKIKTAYREDIKRGLYYIEKMNNLSTSDTKNIKEKLVDNNNKIKKDPNECKGIKYIRYLFNGYENQKSDFYKTEKMKNKILSEIKNKKILMDTKV